MTVSNLKLVKLKLITEKLSQLDREEKQAQALKTVQVYEDPVSLVPSRQPEPSELVLALKTSGFTFQASGNRILAQDIPEPSSGKPRGSLFEMFRRDTFMNWLQDKLMMSSENSEASVDSSGGQWLNSFFVMQGENDCESDEKFDLDAQAKELAYEYLQATPNNTALSSDATSMSSLDVQDFLGLTSSGILKNLNPELCQWYQQQKPDNLFEIIMQQLVVNELQQFDCPRDGTQHDQAGGVDEVALLWFAENLEETSGQADFDLAAQTGSTSEDVDSESFPVSGFLPDMMVRLESLVTPLIADFNDGRSHVVVGEEAAGSEQNGNLADVSPGPSTSPQIVLKLDAVKPASSPEYESASSSVSEEDSSSDLLESAAEQLSELADVVVKLTGADNAPDDVSRKVESPKKPSSATPEELRKLQQELKRTQTEISSLKAENSQLKEDTVRLRKIAVTETVAATPTVTAAAAQASRSTVDARAFPPLVYLLAAIIMGILIGKFFL